MVVYIFMLAGFGILLAMLDNISNRIKNIEADLNSFMDEDVRKAIVNSWLKDC